MSACLEVLEVIIEYVSNHYIIWSLKLKKTIFYRGKGCIGLTKNPTKHHICRRRKLKECNRPVLVYDLILGLIWDTEELDAALYRLKLGIDSRRNIRQTDHCEGR